MAEIETPSPNERERRRRLPRVDRIALAIFLVALAVRLLHLWALSGSPLFNHLVIDSVSYDAKAMDFLGGRWLPREGAFYQAPLYPLFLAGLYRIFGHGLVAVRIVQALLGSGTAVLTYFIGRRCGGKATGIVAGFVTALYAMLIHFDAEFLRPSLFLFLAVLSLHLLLSASASGRWSIWSMAGFALGLGAIARETMLAFIPLAALWAYSGHDRSRAVRTGAAALVLAGALVPVAAVTAVNYVNTHQFVLVSTTGGLNFYLGNNPDYEETISLRPGIRWTLLNREPGVNPITDPVAWSRYYYDKAARYIRSHPLEYGALLIKKFVLFWNGHEIERNSSFAHVAAHSPFLAFPLVSFRWVAPLALVGMVLAWRSRARMGLLTLYLVAQMAAVIAFFVTARYRLGAVPALSVFAGYAVATLPRKLRFQPRSALPYLLLGAAAAVAVNVDAYGISEKVYSHPDYELAMIVRREGRIEESREILDSVLAKMPGDDPNPLFEMGTTLMMLKRNAEAATYFGRAARLEPSYAPSWYNVGLCRTRTGELAAAERALRKALDAQPSYWRAALALGIVLEQDGRYSEAARIYRAASRIIADESERSSALLDAAHADWMAGKREQSLEGVEAVIRTATGPVLVEAHMSRAHILQTMGREDEAVQEAELATQLDPSDETAKALLEELRRRTPPADAQEAPRGADAEVPSERCRNQEETP